ncbi:FG-GAP-like repeat-containing protein [Halocola ammonii]
MLTYLTSVLSRHLKHLSCCAVATILTFACPSIHAQTFTNVTAENFINVENSGATFGNGVSFADFDQDGWDDLSFGTQTGNPVFYKNAGGSFYELSLNVDIEENSAIKAIQWVDFDNDGDLDLFITREHKSVLLFENTGELNLVEITEEAGFAIQMVRNYGASWGDYDKDGDLDVYICKYHNPTVSQGYEYTNHLYENNGDGTFTDVTTVAGVGDGIKASFQSIFFDYNNDGWEDIYVINDRLSFANTLFHNNGDGTFTDVSAASGADVIMDAMTVSVADFDRDEDFDIYITDTYISRLLKNNGNGTFSDVAAEYDLQVFQESWSALWMDYDNNMYEDLHVANINNVSTINFQNHFYEAEDGVFTCVHNEIGLEDDDFGTFSTALGDINNDGFPDFVENNQETAPCQLWQNSGGSQSWLKVDLEGVLSNSKGVGSLIKVYVNDVVQLRYVHLGEAYLSQATSREMIGLKNNDSADSLHVYWPSGIVDRYYDVEANQTLHPIEGETLQATIVSNGQTGICPGDSVLLSVSSGEDFLWSNGVTSQSQWVTAGSYYAFTTIEGITVTTDTFVVNNLPPPAIQATITDVSCFGESDGSVLLTNQNGFGVDQVIWDIGPTGEFLEGLPAGNYQYSFYDNNRCQTEGLITIDEPPLLEVELEVEDQSEEGNGTALVTVSGGTLPYSIFWSVGDSNMIFVDDLLPGEHNVQVVDANGCSEFLTFLVDEYVGIPGYGVNEKINVYPNPFNTLINVNSQEPILKMKLTSTAGKVVAQMFQTNGSKRKQTLNLSQIPSGLYFLIIELESGKRQFKVIKN